MKVLIAVIAALLVFASSAQASDPIAITRKLTVRSSEVTVRAQSAPVPDKSSATDIRFYIDGKLSKSNVAVNTGACLLDYLTHGMVIRLDGCGKGAAPVKITVANASGKPHRVTVVVRFVV